MQSFQASTRTLHSKLSLSGPKAPSQSHSSQSANSIALLRNSTRKPWSHSKLRPLRPQRDLCPSCCSRFLAGSIPLKDQVKQSAKGKRTGETSISAKWFHFKSRKSLNVAVQEEAPGVDEYLQDTERIVHIAFPDSRRLQYLGNGLWRAKLRPVTFFTISATPVTDVRTWYEAGALQISSNRVLLDLAGLPPQFHDIELKLDLRGRLNRIKNPARGPANCAMVGSVDLGVGVDLPLPFSLLPDAAVNGVGNAILEGILVAMESALRRGLVDDYKKWCLHKQGRLREPEVQAR